MSSDARWPLALMVRGAMISQALYVTAQLGLADHLAAGAVTTEQLARAAAFPADGLTRLLRVLASLGLVEVLPEDRFALTAEGQLLRSDVRGSMKWWTLLLGNPAVWAAYPRLLECLRDDVAGFDLTHGEPLFEHLRDDAALRDVFDRAMSGTIEQDTDSFLSSCEIAANAKVVDVGGGIGTLLATLLERHPTATGVLVDRPEVVAKAVTHPRMSTVGGDFFAEVPRGGDVYILSRILHDWNDADARRLLVAVRRAMSATARLLIFDRILAPSEHQPVSVLADLNLLMLYGGRERTRAEVELMTRDIGLTIVREVSLARGRGVLEIRTTDR